MRPTTAATVKIEIAYPTTFHAVASREPGIGVLSAGAFSPVTASQWEVFYLLLPVGAAPTQFNIDRKSLCRALVDCPESREEIVRLLDQESK